MPRATCSECQRGFEYRRRTQLDAARGGEDPPICGRLACRMRHDYGPQDWAGRARMARAKQVASVELDDVDREALRRAGSDRAATA